MGLTIEEMKSIYHAKVSDYKMKNNKLVKASEVFAEKYCKHCGKPVESKKVCSVCERLLKHSKNVGRYSTSEIVDLGIKFIFQYLKLSPDEPNIAKSDRRFTIYDVFMFNRFFSSIACYRKVFKVLIKEEILFREGDKYAITHKGNLLVKICVDTEA